eukprot:22423-Eustigmatos_ZCMA.PRE.1
MSSRRGLVGLGGMACVDFCAEGRGISRCTGMSRPMQRMPMGMRMRLTGNTTHLRSGACRTG